MILPIIDLALAQSYDFQIQMPGLEPLAVSFHTWPCSKFSDAFRTRERMLRLTVLYRLDRFIGCQHRVCEKRIVNERRRIAVAPFGVLWRSGRIFRDGHFEPLLEQFAQVRFDAHVGEHSAKNYLADLAFSELENEVVGLRSPHAMRSHDDGLAVLDVGFEALEPVRAGPLEAVEVQDSLAGEEAGLDLLGFERSVEHPAVVRRIEIVRRDEDLEPMRLRGPEDALHVLDGVVLGEAFFEQRPRSAFFA
jgi:hypothetical protein